MFYNLLTDACWQSVRKVAANELRSKYASYCAGSSGFVVLHKYATQEAFLYNLVAIFLSDAFVLKKKQNKKPNNSCLWYDTDVSSS